MDLSALLQEDVNRLMREPEPLHRFVDTMVNHFYAAVQRIKNNYAGDASPIWSDKPSSVEVVYRKDRQHGSKHSRSRVQDSFFRLLLI